MKVAIDLNGAEATSVLIEVLMFEFLKDRDARDDVRSSLEILRQAPDSELLAAVRDALNRPDAMNHKYRIVVHGDPRVSYP